MTKDFLNKFPETRDPKEKRYRVGTAYHCPDTNENIVIVDDDPRIEIARLQKIAENHKRAREHTWHWLKSHYGKLEEWARKKLPEDLKLEFFGCIANALPTPFSSDYIRYDTAQDQIINDQVARAEEAEAENERLLKRFKAAEAIVKVVLDGQRREFLSSVEALVPDALIEAWLSSME